MRSNDTERLLFWDPIPIVDEQRVDVLPMPEQDDVDEFGEALGVTYSFDEELRCGEKEVARDQYRWELNPASAEDYAARKYSL